MASSAPSISGSGSRLGSVAFSLRSRAERLSLVAFLLVVGLSSYRALTMLNVPGHPTAEEWVLSDFRDAIYFPVVAVLDGNNPYDAIAYARTYPVDGTFSLYSPLTLLVHLPFGLMPLQPSELAYYLLTLALTVALAYLSLRGCAAPATMASAVGLATCILLTRTGHWSLLLGQYAFAVAVAIYLALSEARTRPWIAGLALAFATVKPTFGVPLAILMLCRGDFRAVAIGAAVGGVLSLAALAVVVSNAGGVSSFIASLSTSYADFEADPAVNPSTSLFRVDTVALVSRFAGRVPSLAAELGLSSSIFLLGALGVRRFATPRNAAAQQLSVALVCTTILLCTYHQAYDLVLLAWPLTAIALGAPPWDARPSLRWILLPALGLPAVNYLASGSAVDALGLRGGWWLAVTSFNGAALLLAFSIFLALAHRHRP